MFNLWFKFGSLVKIEVGKGDKILFWRDRWIHGFAVQDIAPTLVSAVDTKTRNARTVEEAMIGERWMHDVPLKYAMGALLQPVHLRHAIATVQRDELANDKFIWPHEKSGEYTAKSTYKQLCQGGSVPRWRRRFGGVGRL